MSNIREAHIWGKTPSYYLASPTELALEQLAKTRDDRLLPAKERGNSISRSNVEFGLYAKGYLSQDSIEGLAIGYQRDEYPEGIPEEATTDRPTSEEGIRLEVANLVTKDQHTRLLLLPKGNRIKIVFGIPTTLNLDYDPALDTMISQQRLRGSTYRDQEEIITDFVATVGHYTQARDRILEKVTEYFRE